MSFGLDYLKIGNDKNVKKMLKKLGDNYPDPEIVALSTKLLKINRKGKEQKRILLLTNKAIYNMKPNKLSSCQRRIMLAAVASITSSLKSQEFTINVPTEYDYRYKATDTTQKNEVMTTLYKLYGKMTGLKLNIHKISESTTEDHTVTKIEAKLITQEQKYRRRQKLTACDDMMYEPRKYTAEEIEYGEEDWMSDKDEECIKTNIITINSKYNQHNHDDYILKLKEDDGKRRSIILIFSFIKNEIENKLNIFIPNNACWLILEYYYIAFMIDNYQKIKIITKIEGGELIKIEPKWNNKSIQRTRSRQSSLKYYEMNGKYFLMESRNKKYLMENENIKYRMFEKRKLLESISKHSLYIIKLHYAFQTKHNLYLIYNYFIGGSLRNALNINNKFRENIVCIWMASISSAIGYLHSYGIFYVDLNPKHIYLDEYGHCHLTNIIPKSFKYKKTNYLKEHKNGDHIAYYAPEILEKNKKYNKSADWWSVGILLFELCVGYTPFYDQNVDKMYKNICYLSFDEKNMCPTNMNKECKDLIKKLLDKNIENRFGSNNDVNNNYVLRHNFFNNINIQKLERKQIASRYIPKIEKDDENQHILSNFDNQQLSNYGDAFVGFNDFVL